MDLDDELRRLFTAQDDRLDVPVRADAEQVIVAGARRVRRRRIAAMTASGAAAVVAIVVGGIVLVGGRPDAMPPAISSPAVTPSWTTTTTSALSTPSSPPSVPGTGSATQEQTGGAPTNEPGSSASVVVPPPKVNFTVVGPYGVGALRLGQSFEDAKATGQLRFGDELVYPPCTAYRMIVDGREIGFAYISLPESGNQVELLTGYDGARTPEGAAPGWTAKQVAAVYPAFDAAAAAATGYGSVAVPGNPDAAYQFWFETDGTMSGFNLRRDGQPCDPT